MAATEWKVEDVSHVPLKRENLFDVKRELIPLAARWKDIGIALRLRGGELDKMDPRHPDQCLSGVLESWLKRNYDVKMFGPPTWMWLVEIVADPAGGNDTALADKIARKHLTVAMHEETDGSTQQLVVPTPKETTSSTWYSCCCFRSSPRKTYFSPTPTARRSARADNDNLVQKPWYHSDISWEKSEERLAAQDSDCFLVRKSQHQEGKLVISVKYGRVIKHHTVLTKYPYYEVEGTEKRFSSMDELIAYYQDNFLSAEEEVLTTPCPRPTLSPHIKQPQQIEIPELDEEPTHMLLPSSPILTQQPLATFSLPPSPPATPIHRDQKPSAVHSGHKGEPQSPRPYPKSHQFPKSTTV